MFQTKVVEKIKTHISFSIMFFSQNRAVYDKMWKKYCRSGRTRWEYGACALYAEVKRLLETVYSAFLTGWLPYCTCCMISCLVYFDVSFKCLVCIVVRWIVFMVVAVLCILWSSYVYLLYWVHWCFTLDAGLLARSQYSEGPATGHLDTRYSWFPCV
jgi:hypothetical protein